MKASIVLFAALGLAFIPAAQAQPAEKAARDPRTNEKVIVTAPRIMATPNAQAHEFIRSVAVPSVLLGAIPRWRVAICPRTDGLSHAEYTSFVTQRIRAVAGMAGAKLAPTPCKPNIEILFTSDPQAALDAVRSKNPDLLGYQGAALVSHPIQAWYQTGITDMNGQTVEDRDVAGSIEFTNGGVTSTAGPYGAPVALGEAKVIGLPTTRIQGWRFRPELTSDIIGVLIIADTGQTASHQLGPIADYVAMLALSHIDSAEKCQGVPSIANILSPGCDEKFKSDEITSSDVAYLRGVYKMDAGASLQVQQDQIAGEMARDITDRVQH